jgi:hypothetical protein
MHEIVKTAGIAGAFLFALELSSAQASPNYDIPKLGGIVVDGTGASWGNRGLVVTPLCQVDDPIPEGRDFTATLRIGWDDRGLLLLARVVQPDAKEADDLDTLYKEDCVELFLAPSRGSKDIAQFVVTAGMDPKHPQLRSKAFDSRVTPSLLKTPLRIEALSSKKDDGYVVEALVPWSDLGIRPRVGATIAFQFSAHDATGNTHTRLLWFPEDGAWADSHPMNVLRLALTPSPSPKAVAFADFADGKLLVHVAAVPELAGTKVEALAGTEIMGSTKPARQDSRATGTITLPLGPSTRPGASISVVAGGEIL